MTTVPSETARVRRIYDAVASHYDAAIRIAEAILFADGRHWVAEQARGRVLEMAVGTGSNFPSYPPGVRITGVDLSPAMLAIARGRARDLDRDVALSVGDAQDLAFPDASFDTVVATLALCSIPDDHRALLEAQRVLRRGGQLLLLEHVRSSNMAVQVIQCVLNPLAVYLQTDHLLRDPLDYLERAGFVLDRVERSRWGIVARLAAHKPAQL